MSFLDSINNIASDLDLFKNNFIEMFSNPRLRNIVIFIFILFFSISIYIYFKFVHPKLNLTYVDNSEFISPKEDKMIVFWFYTDWCPACKSSYPEWTKFSSDVEKANFSIPVNLREINCEVDTNLADAYNIQEYPSIRILYKDSVYVYDAKPDRINLMEFLKGSLPNT